MEDNVHETPRVSTSFEQRFWTTAEIRYLRQHASEGAPAIALALDRTPQSIRCAATRHHIALGKLGPGDLCPRCATYTIAANSKAARHGLCVVCYEKEKSAARRQAQAESDAHREYEKEKKAAQRRKR